jgi:YYY domain-containing protein
VRGAPLISAGAAIANEHFDDPLPFNMDGRIGFGSGPYRGLDLKLYDEDTPGKLDELLDTLDEADYISMSSGRLWQSIPRLPMRYPVTTRYYELLFDEKLGFEKAAEFHSYPRLFGIEFDDTWAEEQFTVYDHPKVLIYRKTEDYDREQVRAMLTEGIDWDNIAYWLNPRDIDEWRREQSRQQETEEQQNDLMLTEEQRLEQERGGTWASIFDRNSFFNHWPTLSWLVLLFLVGLAALPLNLAVFCWLPDRGYILARPVGILLLGWLSWMLTNLTPLHYTRGVILLALALIALVGYASLLLPSQRRRFLDLWRTRKGLILATELLFLAFFVVFWLIRWGNPDLWHAWMGGEKPMDFAYLNAVIKSTEFPPYDPWFAGGFLNYYYFGQVLVGTLIKLIGIVPYVAYNLVIPTWFAMTAMGAFSVTYNLVAKGTRETEGAGEEQSASTKKFRPAFFGLIGALFVTVLGNLGEVHLLLLKAGEGVLESFSSTIPGLAALVRATIGSAEVLFGGKALPISINEWYWNASRAIPAGPAESVITEFPFFTFLYADLHAHLIAMPLALVSLSIALAVVKRVEGRGEEGEGWWQRLLRALASLFLWALVIGAIRTTNSWDVPPHLLVVLGALVIAEFSRRGRFDWRLVWAVAWQFGLVTVFSLFVLYQPFWAYYGSFYNSIRVWTGTRTPLWAYFVVHGLFLFVIVSYLCARVIGKSRRDPLLRRLDLSLRYRDKMDRLREAAHIVGVQGLPVNALVWGAIVVLLLLEAFFLVPGLVSFTRADPEIAATGAHAYRGLSVLALGLPLTILGLLLLFRPRLSPTKRLWTYLVLLGLAMTLGVEVIVIEGDIGRMNTVFKFYLQVWLMWGVAAAAALAWMLPRLQRWSWGRGIWLAILVILVLFGALYPILATTAKVRDRFDTDLGPGLNGWAYMETAHYWDPIDAQYELKWDLEAIRWLLDNVVGTPVILEGHTPEYRWGGRYSINTGLPAVLGWNWHQRQQRAAADDRAVWTRANDVATMYNEPFPGLVEPLLEDYNVRYIIVGPLERAYYEPKGLAKFETMADDGLLQVVFRNDQVTIYEVMRGVSGE